MRRLGLVIALLCSTLTSTYAAPTGRRPRTTAASTPIAVTPFTGLHADEPQAALLRALGDRAALVKPGDLGKVQPYVVLSGAVVKRAGALLVVVDVTNAETRQRMGQVAIPVKSGRHLTPQELAELARQVDELAAKVMAGTPEGDADQAANAAPAPPPSSPQAQDLENAPIPAPLETSAPMALVTPPRPRRRLLPDVPRPRWYPYVEASVGAIVDSRALSFHPSTPPAYNPGTGGGVHVDVTLYPLAMLHAVAHGLFAGLGLGVTVDKPFWPTTRFEGTPNEYATSELRVEGGARWRFVVRRWRPRLEVTLLAGAGLHTYSIAKATDLATGAQVDAGPPDAAYVYGLIGVGLRLVFWHERLMPWVSGVYEYFPDAGPVENVDEYGTSRTHGVMLRGGLDVRVWRRMRVGASAFWELVGLSFTHDLPTARSASRATDQYFGGIFTVGYDY